MAKASGKGAKSKASKSPKSSGAAKGRGGKGKDGGRAGKDGGRAGEDGGRAGEDGGRAGKGGVKRTRGGTSAEGLSIAEKLGQKQKDISVAEFFERNKHILGFDSPTRAVLTSVKEALDNALDACEDAGILPDIYIALHKLPRRDEFLLTVEDNGPGIVGENVQHVFGKLLYGSRFHAIRQSRGQQGIGISAVVMYGQLSTGHPSIVRSKVAENEAAWYQEIKIDTKKNKADVSKRDNFIWSERTAGKGRDGPAGRDSKAGGDPPDGGGAAETKAGPDWFKCMQERASNRKPYLLDPFKDHLMEGYLSYKLALGEEHKLRDAAPRHTTLEVVKTHGVRLSIAFRGRYVRGRQSALEYIRATSIVNPHARIAFEEPDGTLSFFERVTEKLPKPTAEIKPHPQGIELGTLLKMAKETQSYKLTAFLEREFVSISPRRAKQICDVAGLDYDMRPKKLSLEDSRELIEAFRKVKIMAPPTDCLSPIGDLLIKKGLKKEIDSKFAFTTTRPASVYSGSPFQVEAGLVYGGDLPGDASIGILRFANRVPLLYQQGGCVITHAIEGIDWRNYGLEQRGGRGIPNGPAMLLIHLSSTNVPFTSEAKEAVADIPEIQTEVERALRDCARKLKTHINKRKKLKKTKEKFELIQKVLPAIATKSAEIIGKRPPSIEPVVSKIMNIVYVEQEVEYLQAPADGGAGGKGGKAGASKKGTKPAGGGKGGVRGRGGALTLESFDGAGKPGAGGGADGGGGAPAADNGLPRGTGVVVVAGGKAPAGITVPRSRWITRFTVRAINYTPKQKNMTLAVKLGDACVQNISPRPKRIKDGLVLWDFNKVGSSKKGEVTFEILGLDKGDLDEVEVFYRRITGEVIGAETL